MQRIGIAATAAALALALPATVGAATPSKGSFLNDSSQNGAYVVMSSRHTIKTLQFFCGSDRDYFHREMRYEVRSLVHVNRDGSFSRSGQADLFGPEGQPYGRAKVRLKGRFTSSRNVRIKRTLEGCGSATVSAAHR